MNETGLSETAMLASLRDIRLPAEAAGGPVADIAVAVGLAVMAALVVVALLRLLSTGRDAAAEHPHGGMTAGSDWSDARRRVALLHLLRVRDPERYSAIAGDLYRRGGGPDLKVLEAEVERCV